MSSIVVRVEHWITTLKKKYRRRLNPHKKLVISPDAIADAYRHAIEQDPDHTHGPVTVTARGETVYYDPITRERVSKPPQG